MNDLKRWLHLVGNLFITMIFMLSMYSMIFIIVFARFPFFNSKADYDDYLEGKQLVESIKFDNLQTSMFLNGTEIKVIPSAEYPDDKIVEYKNVRFPVENHDEESVVVATYAKIRK